jgi:hypothetical protein
MNACAALVVQAFFHLSVFIRVIRVRQLGRPWVVDMVATLKILEKS